MNLNIQIKFNFFKPRKQNNKNYTQPSAPPAYE